MGIGKSMAVAAVAAATMALAGSAANAATALYSDLGPGHTYDNGGTAWSVDWNAFFHDTPAMSFVASSSGSVTQIDVALQNAGSIPGGDAATVSLWTDNSGLLGVELGAWSVSNFPDWTWPPGSSSNSELATITGITGVNLTAGASYFLQVAPAELGTNVVWNFNTVGATGAFLEGGVPVAQDQTTGAFDILGTTSVPEPATWAMLILGLGLIGLTARRRTAGAALAA